MLSRETDEGLRVMCTYLQRTLNCLSACTCTVGSEFLQLLQAKYVHYLKRFLKTLWRPTSLDRATREVDVTILVFNNFTTIQHH